MKIEEGKVIYRRAGIDDVSAMVDLRVRFLNELYNHSEDAETAVIRESLQDYFMKAIIIFSEKNL